MIHELKGLLMISPNTGSSGAQYLANIDRFGLLQSRDDWGTDW
jgi:hypothetical protein